MNKKYLMMVLALGATLGISALFYACGGSTPGGGGATSTPGLTPTAVVGTSS